MDFLMDYSSAESSDSDSECDIRQEQIIIRQLVNHLLIKVEREFWRRNYGKYRTLNFYDSDDTDESDLSPWSIDSDDELNDGGPKNTRCITKGELTVENLPKIERLNLTCDVEELIQVGIVCSMVGQLVVVQSFRGMPPLDLDSVLFMRNGSELGQIFDVIGAVKQPNYVIRFNSIQEIKDLGVELHNPVYFNPGLNEPYTKYVFVNDLQKQKGSDASWKHDNEPPPEELDYSDDETEMREKLKRKAKKRPHVF